MHKRSKKRNITYIVADQFSGHSRELAKKKTHTHALKHSPCFEWIYSDNNYQCRRLATIGICADSVDCLTDYISPQDKGLSGNCRSMIHKWENVFPTHMYSNGSVRFILVQLYTGWFNSWRTLFLVIWYGLNQTKLSTTLVSVTMPHDCRYATAATIVSQSRYSFIDSRCVLYVLSCSRCCSKQIPILSFFFGASVSVLGCMCVCVYVRVVCLYANACRRRMKWMK